MVKRCGLSARSLLINQDCVINRHSIEPIVKFRYLLSTSALRHFLNMLLKESADRENIDASIWFHCIGEFVIVV